MSILDFGIINLVGSSTLLVCVQYHIDDIGNSAREGGILYMSRMNKICEFSKLVKS